MQEVCRNKEKGNQSIGIRKLLYESVMFELNEQQKKEDFNRRLNLFQEALKGLSENYSLMIEPTLHITSRGLIPVLSINDTKYAPVSSKESPLILPKESTTQNEKSLENDKKALDGNPETPKK